MGQYPQSSGKKGGTLRRGWTSKTHEDAEKAGSIESKTKAYANSLEIEHNGDSLVIHIVNPVEYASYAEFGDEYTTYTESVEQGLKEPCFFISCINPASRVFLGKRYFRENKFCIQYFPADKYRAKEECSAAAERFFSCLEYITVNGDLVRGTKMKYEVADGIMNFFVNYDFFVYKNSFVSEPMDEISKNIALKEGDNNGSK